MKAKSYCKDLYLRHDCAGAGQHAGRLLALPQSAGLEDWGPVFPLDRRPRQRRGYTVGEASVSGEVRELDVSWLSGSVTVELTDGDAVTPARSRSPRAVMPVCAGS